MWITLANIIEINSRYFRGRALPEFTSSHLTIKTVQSPPLFRASFPTSPIWYFPPWHRIFPLERYNLAPKGNIRCEMACCLQDTPQERKAAKLLYHRSWGFIIHRVGEARSWEEKRKEKKKKKRRKRRLGEEEREEGDKKLKIS